MVESKMTVAVFKGKAETKVSIWKICVWDVGCFLPPAECVTIVSKSSVLTLSVVFPQVTHEREEEVNP